MSIFDDIGHFFSGAISTVGDLASKVWHAIAGVWAFLVRVAGLVTGAWDWMVNGVTWFTSQIGDWASWVYNTIWHILTKTIPDAATWAIRQATKWAANAVHNLRRFLEGVVKNIVKWITGEIHKLARTAKHWVSDVIKWVTGPIRWVLNVGKHVANLVLHPKALAEWIVGALIVPLIMWFLRSSAPVVAWLIKSIVQRDSELAHLIEDVLAKVI